MDTTGYPFDDTQDFDDTERGFIARATTRQVTAADIFSECRNNIAFDFIAKRIEQGA